MQKKFEVLEFDREGLKRQREGRKMNFEEAPHYFSVVAEETASLQERRHRRRRSLAKVATFTGQTPRYRQDVRAGFILAARWNRRLIMSFRGSPTPAVFQFGAAGS